MDLPAYLQLLRQHQQLLEIEEKVSCSLELSRCCRQQFQQAGPALFFSHLQESKFQVAANLFGSQERLQLLLQSPSLDDFASRIRNWLPRCTEATARTLIPAQQTNLRLWQRPDVRALPALCSWPQEQHPYLTLALAITRHPQTGHSNLGLYRVQVLGESRLAINFSSGSDAGKHLAAAEALGRPLPVALVLGGDPGWIWAASAPWPDSVDEFACWTALCRQEQSFFNCASQPLQVPIQAELVIEGEIAPGARCVEGPFANHSGQYVRRNDCPLMQVTAIQSRPQPIIPQTVVGPPPSENIYLGKANEVLYRELLRLERPEIIDLQMPLETIFHGASILSVRLESGTSAQELIAYLQNESPLRRAKFILLVDPDIELNKLSQCWWRAINQLQSERLHQQGNQLIIDATGVDPNHLVVDNLFV